VSELTANDAACILAEALVGHLIVLSEHRADGCDAIGQVLCGTMEDTRRVSFVFKYDLHTETWGINEVPVDKYPANTILYYHDTEEDAVTQAALHGDELGPEDSEL
jgi:hypothetical protein